MRFKTYLQHDQDDFFKIMTGINRMRDGHPQEYGFHHDMSDENRGTFMSAGTKGVVKKSQNGAETWYVCIFDKDALVPAEKRLGVIVEMVRDSVGHDWRYVPPESFAEEKGRFFTVVADGADVVIKVKGETTSGS